MISGLVVVFLLVDSVMKLMKAPVVIAGTADLGYPESSIVGIGILLLACTLLHLIPGTSVLGAVLLTGYFGRAIATHVRVGNPLFTHILGPVYFAAMIWGGLYLRDPRVRQMLVGSERGR